jgi:hypothetical protein
MSSKQIEPAYTFFYAPGKLPAPEKRDAAAALAKVKMYAHDPPNDRQTDAIAHSFGDRLSMLWGPPGTGKTATLGVLALTWLEDAFASGAGLRICIGASNYNAIDNVLRACAELLESRRLAHGAMPARVLRIRSSSSEPRDIAGVEDIDAWKARSWLPDTMSETHCLFVVGGTHQQLLKMTTGPKGSPAAQIGAPWFDLLVIDEASQVASAAAMAYMCLLKPTAHVVVCGDHQQLGPVYQYKVEDSRSGLLDCIFSYYRIAHQIKPVNLAKNYRSNEAISGWPSRRFYEDDYESHHKMRRLNVKSLPSVQPSTWPAALAWSPHWQQLLDPDAAVLVVCYDESTSTVSNLFEAQVAAALVNQYNAMLSAEHGGATPADFWRQRVGLVTPHRAQIATIRNLLGSTVELAVLDSSFIDTVDRFQGQERDLIVASYTVSDPDFIASEEEFILDPRRFNVTLTRARMKFIMLVSKSLLSHLPADDTIARGAAHLQLFPEGYCAPAGSIDLPYVDATGTTKTRRCQLYSRALSVASPTTL